MSKTSTSLSTPFLEIRQDCLIACNAHPAVRIKLKSKRIAVTGGTGFLGTWIAEMVAALNDNYQLDITLDLYARNISEWVKKYPHLATRSDIHTKSQDVRSSFEFEPQTNFVVHAAGIPNNRVHASEPFRVQQTTVAGISNALEAAAQLNHLIRFLNVSSCLVNGIPNRSGPISEVDCFPIPSGQLHRVYIDAKRSAESIAAIFRSQFRMPVTTIRPFTFTGPYQELDRPWAINSFLNDAITGRSIRIHGDGSARRSYLYGSDAAWWALTALVNGDDGAIYNVGSPISVSHLELIKLISQRISPEPHVALNTAPPKLTAQDDLFPDITTIQNNLGVTQTCSLEHAVDKTWRWHSSAKI